MKVIIVGGSIAGNVILQQLRKRNDVEVKAYEKRSAEEVLPPPLNVLIGHNGMASVALVDPELHEKLRTLEGCGEVKTWKARTVSGEELYEVDGVLENGDAVEPAIVARYDRVYEATRCDELTEYNVEVAEVKEETIDDNTSLSVKLVRGEDMEEEWITGIDLMIVTDPTLRHTLVPTNRFFGPPFVGDFRFVATDLDESALSTLEPFTSSSLRIYNKPSLEAITAEFGSENPTVNAAASGHVSLSLVKMSDNTLSAFGNVALAGSETVDPALQSGDLLAKLFSTTSTPDEEPDAIGKLVIDILQKHGSHAHWARKQQTDTCYEAFQARVLFVGDAAGETYSTLGHDINLHFEDAAVVACAFPNASDIAKMRHERHDFIKDMSRYHARHISDPDFLFDTEINNWELDDSLWHADLHKLWGVSQVVLRATTTTQDNFSEFGEIVAESLEGDLFRPNGNDATLDLSKGQPRLSLIRFEGGRPLLADRITRHCNVTKCLGGVSLPDDFYLVVHKAGETPTLDGLKAFRIPPRHFVKLNLGTWYAGPMWSGPNRERTFMMLELSDTYVEDRDTIPLCNIPPHSHSSDPTAYWRVSNDTEEAAGAAAPSSKAPLVIPVAAAADQHEATIEG